MKPALFSITAGFALTLTTSAQATVDAFIPYTIVYEEIQTGDLCLGRMPMWAEIGIPEASAAEATFAPSYIVQQNSARGLQNVNINVLGKTPKIKVSYVDSSWDESVGTIGAKFTIDLSAATSYNGSSVEGRSAARDLAKLSLLALANNMKTILFGPYRNFKLEVTFTGLPSQSGLSGEKVHATTHYPYTAGSPLLKTYAVELLNREGSCSATDRWF